MLCNCMMFVAPYCLVLFALSDNLTQNSKMKPSFTNMRVHLLDLK